MGDKLGDNGVQMKEDEAVHGWETTGDKRRETKGDKRTCPPRKPDRRETNEGRQMNRHLGWERSGGK